MSEKPLWSGTSSQWTNFWPFVICILLLPIPWAIYRWLLVKSRKFELTSERLITKSGILSVTTDTLELYRVHDMNVTESFIQRMLGLKTIELITGDTTSPRVPLDSIPADLKLEDIIRRQVEECRMRKRVRTLDIDDGPDLHPGEGGALS